MCVFVCVHGLTVECLHMCELCGDIDRTGDEYHIVATTISGYSSGFLLYEL